MNISAFYLKVQRIEQVCLFELSWGGGQELNTELPYPQKLTILYQEWHEIYLTFYKTALRGKVEEIGSITTPPIDWHTKLVQAEAKLLSEFHLWLRSRELYEIRAAIAKASRNGRVGTPDALPHNIDILLTCNPLDLERLPWEAWEIGTEFASKNEEIRIVRRPINIQATVTNLSLRPPRKVRVLAILGDDTGLNFQGEMRAIKSLNQVAEVVFIGWQPGKNTAELKTEIVNALTSERGWDILFFAGHSNETNLTGGELVIAPNTALSISEIEQPLTMAKQRGLQFAIFNSCNGLSIANKLIDLGLSQVAVMREPIHNRVAEEFFVRFLQAVAEYKDVHSALLAASQYLKSEKNLTYPSVYFIPSLFRHPDAPLFRLKPFGLKQRLKSLIPTRREAIALSALVLISLLLPVQGYLLDQRLLVQAIYRRFTGQVDRVATPPVLLVQIDNDSIKKAKISNPNPIDRRYLARLVERLAALKARVVGVDYVLDRNQGDNDRILAQSIQSAIQTPTHPLWFVFATTSDKNNERLGISPKIASPNWSLQGEIDILPQYMQLFPLYKSNSEPLFFAGLLAISHQLQQLPNVPQPQLNSQKDFFSNLDNRSILMPERSRLRPLTALSYWLGQMWLHPIIDFSIPSNQVYHTVPAWKFLESQGVSNHLQQQVVIIAAAYDEAGVSINGEDQFDLPAAVAYWRRQDNSRNKLTGGEYHAYMVHHLLTQRLVVPIPDLWMIGLAILLGKAIYLSRRRKLYHPISGIIVVTIITIVYGMLSLQLYISSTAILLPWFLPSVTLWLYALPPVFRKKPDA